MKEKPKKHVYNITIFDDEFILSNRGKSLLNILLGMKGETNRITVKKDVLAKEVKKNRRTISGWLAILGRAGAIKYNYSGDIMINPNFAYDGPEENYERVLNEWKQFRSVTSVKKPA